MEVTSEVFNNTRYIDQTNSTVLPPIVCNTCTSSFDQGGSFYWVTVTSFIISLLITCAGLIGNVCIIATVRNRSCQFSSHGIHLTALAVADMKVLLLGLLNRRFVWNYTGTDIRGVSIPGCRAVVFAVRMTKFCSIFCVVLICIERFVAVWFPLKARVMTTKYSAIATVATLFAVSYAFALTSAFFGTVKDGKCVPDVIEGSMSGSRTLTTTVLILTTIIPTIALIVFTTLTILKLFYQRVMRRALGNTSSKDETYRTTVMLVSISVTYLLLVTSFTGAVWILMLNDVNAFLSPEPWAALLLEVLLTCENLNASLNFFLYWVFSSSFRRDFRELIRCKRRSNAVGPSA